LTQLSRPRPPLPGAPFGALLGALFPLACLAALCTAPLTAQQTPAPKPATKPEPPKPAVDSAFKRAGDEPAPGNLPATKPTPQDTVFAPTFDASAPWLLSYFPYLTGGANDAPTVAFRARYWRPADLDDRVTQLVSLTADAGVSFRGSRFVDLRLFAPHIAPNWRLSGALYGGREARFGYFGLGNTTTRNEDLADSTQPYLYRVGRTRYEAQGELSRRLAGQLWLGLMGDFTASRFGALDGPSIFRSSFGPELDDDDVSGRAALVYDARDNEYNTHRGYMLEAGAQVGSGGDGYHRFYGIASGWLPVREGTVLAARLLGSGMGGTPPLNARFIVPAWERTIGVLGGAGSNRALTTGRFAGTGVLVGNFEVRQDVMSFGGDIGRLGAMAFLDAGRVFEGEDFRLTLKALSVGGGGGLWFRVLRSTIVTATVARGPDGTRVTLSNGWMF
jgi:hypothetical protein